MERSDVAMGMRLVEPSVPYADAFAAALARGWSPNTERPEAAGEALAELRRDPVGLLETLAGRFAPGATVTLPDGSTAPRLPGFSRWMWDGEFAGAINVRWQPGTTDLPPHVLGHIGYTVVPWKQRRGYATRALALMLPLAGVSGLPYVELSTNDTNVGSQRVIEANGGVLVSREERDSRVWLLYRIALAP